MLDLVLAGVTLPDGRVADLSIRHGKVVHAGAPERAHELHRLGSELSAQVADPSLRAMLVASYARIVMFLGEGELSVELASEALGLAEHVSDPALRVQVVTAAVFSLIFAGRPAEALEALDRKLAPRLAAPRSRSDAHRCG